ncbi:Lar family restriction alleviation protein [Agrobacterium radiobacter]|uniref:Lar family restriction alleviation protein n=1 Tax=Agrobacterium radiobacter TaxID=362 RepID=UPI0034453193
MQSEELKPCPFCGGKNLSFRLSDIEGWIAHVECTDCDDMLGPMSEWKHDDKEDAEKDAAAVWNRRPCLEAALSAAEPQPAPSVAVKALDWSGFKGVQINDQWMPDDQELIYTAVGVYDGDGDMDDDAREQIIERLLAAWQRSALSAQVQDVAGWQDEEKLTPKQAWTILCETPDITSPEEYPDHALITFEQLQSYMERAHNPVAWQDISTAPRDGTKILMRGGAYHGVPFPGYWNPSSFAPDRPWVSVVNDSRLYEHVPTHWMPLPAAPAKQEGCESKPVHKPTVDSGESGDE